MKKIFSYLLRALIILAAIFILVWVFFFAYLTFNRQSIIAKVKAQIGKQITGIINIGDLKPDFVHAFPYPAIRISNVTIRDSAWQQHHHDFLNAPVVYVRLKPITILTAQPAIGKVTIENGAIYFYTDPAGHSNIVKTESAESGTKKDIPTLQFEKTRFIIHDENKHKLHDIYCEKLKCDFDKEENLTRVFVKLKTIVHSLSFNSQKGSYLQEKRLEGKFELVVKNNNTIEFKNIDLAIDKQPFIFSGRFLFDQQSFDLSIETRKIRYEKILAIIPESIRQKLKLYSIDVPLSVQVHLSGSLHHGTTPLTSISFDTKKAHVTTPAAQFKDCAFTARFTNQDLDNDSISDANSRIVFEKFSGSWEKMLLRSDSIVITDLRHPVINCNVRSKFELKELNELSGSSTIQFLSGEGDLSVRYKGSLAGDSIAPSINGTVVLKNSTLSYLPRHFALKNCTGIVEFKNQDVLIKNLSAIIGRNQLIMNGSVLNLLTLLNTPERLTINWNIHSPDLDVNNFISYLGHRATTTATSKKKFFRIADKVDRMLKDGTANIHVDANRLSYKKFLARNVSASVLLLQNKILLNEVKMSHAGGTITVAGSLADQAYANALNFTARLDHVIIPEVFYAFGNFGQDAITDNNMKGSLSADVAMSGLLTDRAAIVQNSLAGKIDFSIENGELINFEPVKKISETAFKKRDFSDLRFAELKNNIEISGSAIKIPNMEIHSNMLTMFVQGVYDVKKGTDMSIRVPVRNLKKPEPDIVPKNQNKAGLSIRLRAKTGSDGKLKVTWDPFNKSGKTNSISKATPVQQ